MTTTEQRIRRAAMFVLGFTALFYLPSLACGFMADDWFHRLALDQLPELFEERLNIFGFIQSAEQVEIFKHYGLAPWWTSEEMRINFYRPIPSITHWLEYQFVGHSAVVAHLVSIAWYLLSVYLVYRLFSRFLPKDAWTLPLAVLVFALDDAHALNIAWIANRNEIIGGCLLLVSLLAFLRWREGGGRFYLPLTMVAYVAALLSKESTLVLPVFVFAHVLVFPEDRNDGLWARLRPHLPFLITLAVVSVAWVIIYFSLGHGANSVYYINPLKNPGLWATQFFRSGFYHAVILVTGVPLHVLSGTPAHDYPAAAVVLGTLAVAFWALVIKWLRHDRPLRFFLITMLASQALLTTSFPDPRNLFLPSIGFAYIVVRLAEEAWNRRAESRVYRVVLGVLGSLHLVLAPALCVVCIVVVASFNGRYETLRTSLTRAVDYEQLPEEGLEIFFLNWHQREMTAAVGLYLRRVLPTGIDDYTTITEDDSLSYIEKLKVGLRTERIHYHALSYLLDGVELTADGDRSFTIRPREGGFFPSLFEQLYTTTAGWKLGQSFNTGIYKARIQEINDKGEVRAVHFTFPEPLNSPRYRFLHYDGESFVPYTWPGKN